MHNTALKEIGLQKFGDDTFNDLLAEFNSFSECLISSVDYIKESLFDKKVCFEVVSDFYLDGWDLKFSNEGNFYELKNNFDDIVEVVTFISAKEDLSDTKRDIQESLKELWLRLPNFYKACEVAEFKSVVTPSSYMSQDPFPEIFDKFS